MQGQKETRSLTDLLSDLTREVSTLFREEVRLARTEISEKVSQLGVGVGSLVAGGMIILIGLFFIVEAIVFGIAALLQLWVSEVVAAWLAPLLVGLVAALVGWGLISKGRASLRAENLAPQRTAGSLRKDEEMIAGRFRSTEGETAARG